MDERNSETDRLGDSAKSIDRQSKSDFTRDSEKQCRTWASLVEIEAGLERITDGIQLAEECNLRAREYLDELERQEPELEPEIGRPHPEAEVLRDPENAQHQSRQLDNQPRNSEYQRKQSDSGLEL